jgi:hypothetical protein
MCGIVISYIVTLIYSRNSWNPTLSLASEVLGEEKGFFIDQRLKGLMLPVSDPINLDINLEDLVQLSKKLIRL